MRKSVSYKITYVLAAAFAVFFAISSCVKQDKILLLDKDNSSLSVFAKLFDDGVDYLSGVATKSAQAKEDTDTDIVKDDDVDARSTLHETLIETLDIFVKVESASETEPWLKVYHLDKNTSGVILNTSDPGGLMDKARQVLAKYWPDEGYDPDIAYHIYVTANNPHTHNCTHTTDQHYRADETSVPANLQELKALSTYDSATDKYYTDGTIPERTNRTNTKVFLMDGDIIWSPKPEEGDQVWDVDLKRAVSKVLMNLTMSEEFKQDSLEAVGWTAGAPMWRYVHFGFEVADIADGTYELDMSTVGNPYNTAPFKIGSLCSTDGDEETYTYQILTYSAPFKWGDYSTAPYMLVSIAYTYVGTDPAILDKYPTRRRTCYYHIPICDAEVVAPEGLKRNNIYITDAEIGSFGSENEELEGADFQLRIEYHVVPWTVTNINHEATVIKLGDVKYLTVYPTTYTLKGDDIQSVDLDWYASVSLDDKRFVDIDLSSVQITYENYLGNTIDITGSQSGSGTADYIYKTPATPDGTTNITIRSYAPNGSLGANGEVTEITVTRDGLIKVSSEALKSRAVKTIKFTVKLNTTGLTKEVVIKHYPLDNIQSFTGSWSSRWDGVPYSYTETRYTYDVTKYYRKRYYRTTEGWESITQAEWAAGIGSDNDNRRNANSQANAINGYYATGGSQTTVTNSSSEYSGTIPSNNVTYSWSGNVLTVSGTGGGGGGGGGQARSYTVTGYDYYVNTQTTTGQGGNRTVSIPMWKYSNYYKWGSTSEYAYEPADPSSYDGWTWVECTEAEYNASSSDNRMTQTETVTTDYLPDGITDYTEETVTVDGQAGTGDWVEWGVKDGTTSDGIFTAKVYYNGNCYQIYDHDSRGSAYDNLTNNHMYVIQITSSSSTYALGKPVLDGNYQSQDHVVSPAFMIASQLGAVQPTGSPTTAATHCGTYMEVGTDGTRYTGWRLPTEEEINVIIGYQNGDYTAGVTMVEVLGGRYYWTLNGTAALVPTGTQGSADNAYVRCVRDLSLAEINQLDGE